MRPISTSIIAMAIMLFIRKRRYSIDAFVRAGPPVCGSHRPTMLHHPSIKAHLSGGYDFMGEMIPHPCFAQGCKPRTFFRTGIYYFEFGTKFLNVAFFK